ncbi:hypothetical protein GCM10011617_17760 [Novosphingobium arvoryzae]|uniref:Uncharacterized protein n=1 Tax=Novosphingobium arvoryzae TaxID=1256514 RepID=A0A918RG11_9SPHN|nr:hypothetical protein GCM10011617_17760 [Novosphingobium arvoryzae]
MEEEFGFLYLASTNVNDYRFSLPANPSVDAHILIERRCDTHTAVEAVGPPTTTGSLNPTRTRRKGERVNYPRGTAVRMKLKCVGVVQLS